MNKTFLKYSIGFTSFLLAGVAAYFSITGLAKLFAGTGAGILVMASALEFSKLITVSYLYRFWSNISLLLKTYLLSAVFILMMITSLGIYGFLTAGYQDTKGKFDIANTTIITYQNQKQAVDNKVISLNANIETYKGRIQDLSQQRNNTEKRIDKSFDSNKFSISNKQSNIAKYIDSEIKNINNKIDTLETLKLLLLDSSSNVALKIKQTDINNQNSSELGPLVIVSNITGINLDKLVTILICLFIFVFDPLAIALLIVFNTFSQDSTPNNTVLEAIKTSEPLIVESDIKNQESPVISTENMQIIEDTPAIIEPEVKQPTHTHTTRPRLYTDGR